MDAQPPDRRWRTTQPGQTRAQQLRREQTEAEAIMWAHLRGHRLDGHKFRRQHPIGRFIVDFCCVKTRLIVEIDGSVHQDRDQSEYDAAREDALHAAGYRIVRYTNAQIADDIDAVLIDLLRQLADMP